MSKYKPHFRLVNPQRYGSVNHLRLRQTRMRDYYGKTLKLSRNVDREIRAKFTKQEYERTLSDPVAFHKWILGEPIKLSPAQEAILRAVAQYPEVLVIAGAKGGKSRLSGFAALWMIYRLLTMDDPIKHYRLPPGSNIYVMNIAPKEDLALNIVLNYIRGDAEASWYLSRYIETHRAEEVIFVDHIIARAQGSSSRAGLGYAIFGLIMDEVCHFMDTRGNMAGTQVYNNYTPRLLPFGTDGRVFAISTAAGRQGVGYEMFTKGVPVKPYLLQPLPTHGEHNFRAVFQVPTWEMNPLYPRDHPFIMQQFKRDPVFAEMEFGARFADVVSAFFNLKQLEACIEHVPLPIRDSANNYVICHDPSLRRDAYALVMGHLTREEKIRVDLAMQWLPDPETDRPVNIAEVEDYIKDLCARYNVVDVLGDESRAGSTIKRLESMGLPSRGMKYGARSDVRIYQPLLECVNTRTISFSPYEPLLTELRFLERITMSDRYRVQAAPGNSDDLADCVAMLAYVLKVEKAGGGGVLLT